MVLTWWFQTPIEVVFLYTTVLLIWGSAVVRTWRYRPPTEEKLALVRNFQMHVTLCLSAMLFLLIMGLVIVVFHVFTPAIIWTLLSLAGLSFLGIVVLAWQQHLLTRAKRSGSAL